MKCLLLIQAAATLFMTGVIWCVQVVNYPLMAYTSPESFVEYEATHVRLISRVVMAPMLVELILAVMLAVQRPAGVSQRSLYSGILLVAVIWTCTFLVQVPQHDRLARGFDPLIHQRLVISNWVRTIAWSLRSVLVLWMLR